ncbi:MAG TPA: anti-sigma factor [Flavobacteriaceae bacterium]|nr:anti-sigma factor [Flavobacteriaceae bacterium]
MNIEEYIQSGILELYVYGALTKEESIEVSEKLKKYPDIRSEVEEIEDTLQNLSSAVAPYNPNELLASIKQKLRHHEQAVPFAKKPPKTPISTYLAWAACFIFLVGIVALWNSNQSLRDEIKSIAEENAEMENEIENMRLENRKSQKLLDVFRDQNIARIVLAGQEASPKSKATVFWDKQKDMAYIDAKDLPAPPPGKVYQVWSLTLEPLKPVSMGLLENFNTDANKIFILQNPNQSEAFGITLEPEGGSETPTMEQLYVLGTIGTKSA